MLCHIMLTPTESMWPSVIIQTLNPRAFSAVLYRMSNCEDFFLNGHLKTSKLKCANIGHKVTRIFLCLKSYNMCLMHTYHIISNAS